MVVVPDHHNMRGIINSQILQAGRNSHSHAEMSEPHEPRILAKFASYGAMLDALRARLDELGITHARFDSIAGLADGYTNKVLKPVPIRHLLPNTLQFFIEGAAVELWLVERPDETAKLKARSDFEAPRWPKKRVELHREGASPAQVRKLAPLVARELGRKGGRRRAESLGAKRLSEIGQKGAEITNKKRWGS
jgi:hypothetical protein